MISDTDSLAITSMHLATDTNGTPEVHFKLVPGFFIGGALNDTNQCVSSVVDDNINAAKMFMDLLEERFDAVGWVSDVIFNDEKFIRRIRFRERGDTGRFACNSSNAGTICDRLPDGGLTDTTRGTGD